MEMEIKIKGCPFEDAETLNSYMFALDMQSAIHETREHIRSLIKHQDLDEDCIDYLRDISEMLYVEGLE